MSPTRCASPSGLAAWRRRFPARGRVADDVIDFARANNVTQIVIGKSSRTRWFELLYGSVVHELVRRSGNISVHVIAGDALKEEAIPRKTVRTATPGANVAGYFAAVWVTAAGTLAAELLKPYFGGETVPLIYMMGVLGVAYLSGLGPSLFAALASMLCYNFFFIPPILQLHHRRSCQHRRSRSSSCSRRSLSAT